MLMEINMKEIGKMIYKMVMEFIHGLMELNMKDSGIISIIIPKG